MEAHVRVVIYSASDNIYDNLIIAPNIVGSYNEYPRRHDKALESSTENKQNCVKMRLSRRSINAYLISAYTHTLRRSDLYRQAALQVLLEFIRLKTPKPQEAVIYIRLKMPRHQWLDYQWNDRVTQMALERRELDHAMSWLSTLGGGFSALGETFEHCAEMAGRISVRQLQLALRLGDSLLVARCKLWAALSLLQRGCLKVAKNIVEQDYRLAVQEKDVRLQNMCKGVWAKLQYSYKLRATSRRPLVHSI